ncbi:MAG: hypothetical protein EZS26_000945 [Candidatus Ordinivivax streblomastigis]|uniref:Fibronectin type-III domain-containing protein n=1 Tax=Candidatus Ordinivivax streblomastigis TaxID=2540710 RepID=A0A5M8P2S6_9BACT|nr:MAG: hypothetical protein EZS26_000945 [Candidatus Ordinivivax streblomastigis]
MKTKICLSLFLLCSGLSGVGAVNVSDLPKQDDIGGVTVADLAQFNLSLSDFTLEIAGTAGQAINIAGGLISYTPTATGTVRFACKDLTVFVFEGQVNHGFVALNMNAINYPDIFGTADNASNKTGIYDVRNLFLNPGFETKDDGTVPTADNYLPKDWTGDGFAVSGGSRARYQISEIAADREGNCSMMTHQGRYLAQTVALQSYTPYKLKIRRWVHNGGGQQAGIWYIGLGSAAQQYEIFRGEFSNGADANYTKYDHEYTFYADNLSSYANTVFSVYPYDKNGSDNLAISHYDRMTLVSGVIQTGITGATSAVYLAGTAYAPEGDAGSMINLNNAGTVIYPNFDGATVIVAGKTDLHITDSTPLTNSTVNLTSDDSWLFFDAVKPSAAITQLLKTKFVTINGDSVVLKLAGASDNSNQNARIAPYGFGSVLIPNGNKTDATALQVFTEANYAGSSKQYPIFTRHTSLGTFNNAIRSFKLKRGYMATLANKTDGTGFSKVFIADKEDIEIPVMPKGMEGTVSFIRVFRWDWVSQKGYAGGGEVAITNSTSFYDWNSGGTSTNPDYNYVLIKQKLGWPGDDVFNTKVNISHLLGYNEPDHAEQHEDDNGGKPITIEQAIERWPAMMASGLRLGTPAATDFNWLYNFLTACDKLNYRVDFVAIHSYWYTSMSSWRSQLQAVWNNGKRPIWITEWNNGANWTSHNFPDATGAKCDADGNVISGGGTVTLPNTVANAAKQLSDIQGIIGIMEEAGTHIERYFFYNWVLDARSIVLNNKLTPAGKWYASNPSKLAFSEPYDHKWKLVVPDMTYTQSTTDLSKYTFSWKDYNGETAKGYVLESKIGAADWVRVGDTIPASKSDAAGIPTLTATAQLTASTQYRYKVIGYEGSEATSTAVYITADPVIASPVLIGEAQSSSWIKLTWGAVTNAKGYRIKRATSLNGDYTIVKDNYTGTSYDDNTGLQPNTIYYYKVNSLNNRGESADGIPVKVITKKIGGADGDGDETGIERVNVGVAATALVEIFDLAGNLVSTQLGNEPAPAISLPGIYIVRTTSNGVATTSKLIVK